jgi:hypothetical protein
MAPEPALQEHWKLGGRNGNQHVDDEWDCGEPSPQTDKYQKTTADLEDAVPTIRRTSTTAGGVLPARSFAIKFLPG